MNRCIFVVIIFALLKVNSVRGTAGEISNCRYELKDKTVTFNDSIVNVRIPGQQLFISLCTTSIKGTCRDEVSACLIDEVRPRDSIYNLGEYFIFMKDPNGNNILKTVNGQKCDVAPSKNYSLIIHLDCDDLLKNGPMFLSKQRCEYHIRMLHPACSPRCTTRVGKDNYLLDLQNLENLGDIKISDSNRTFYVSLCGPATNCGSFPEYMACEIQNNNINAIATLETQHVNYNDKLGVLSIRGRTGDRKRYRKNAELFLKCNWEESNVKAAFQKLYSGNKYTFQLESRHFCFKLPSKCLVTNRQYFYDISSLNRGGRYPWSFNGLSTDDSIYINVCGPLQNTVGKCKDQEAQVCLYKRGTGAISLGSVASNLEVTDNNSLKLTYKDGSRCNSNETYRTEIEFICSEREYGPKIISVNGCVYSLVWNTPTACPNHMVQGEDNCKLFEQNGYQRNLLEVHTSKDRIVQINDEINFRFNLCGSLVTPCAGVDKASACLERNGREYIVGWDNKKLTNLNGKLFLKLEDKMKNRMYKVDSSTTVYFHCNYTASREGHVSLNYTSDLKTFNLNVDTPLACVSENAVDCTAKTEHFTFDLSPLSSAKSNYVVNSGDEDFILNVCRSVMNTEDDLCPVDSPVCLKKKSEPNLINRYRRFGAVAGPEWTNNELIIHYKNGGYCKNSTMFETSSTIHFRCSTQEKQPEILKKDYCSVEFIWFTKHACQTATAKCCFNTSTSVVDLSFMKSETFRLVSENNTFYFNLCSPNYKFCKENDNCSIIESIPQVVSEKNITYLVYKIANNETNLKGLWIELVCDFKINSFQIQEKIMTNNTRYVSLKTDKFCQSEKSIKIKDSIASRNEKEHKSTKAPTMENDVIIRKDSSLLKKQNTNTFKNIPSASHPVPISTTKLRPINDHSNAKVLQSELHSRNCSVRSPDTHQVLLLASLSPWNVLGKTSNYFVSLGSLSPACNGYICKNNTILALPSSNCPEVTFGSSSVRLSYTQFKGCSGENYRSSILLKCRGSSEEGPFVSQEDICSVEIVYPTNEACKLFNSLPTSGLNLGAIFGIAVSCLIIVVLVVAGIILYRKFCTRLLSSEYSSLGNPEQNPKQNCLLKLKKI